jgi:hypothetical protein
MSVAVALEVLEERIAEFGPHPYLITVSAEGRAHVVSVSARFENDMVVTSAGRSSRANAEAQPAVTLLWPAAGDGDYSLIVDGESSAAPDGMEEVMVRPTRAVLHRVASASTDLPSCIRIEDAG